MEKVTNNYRKWGVYLYLFALLFSCYKISKGVHNEGI